MTRYEEWIERAKSSLELAQAKIVHYIYYEDLCYQSQQAVEKALKGFLIYYGVDPEFTHNIELLLKELKKFTEIPENIEDAIRLTDYAVQTRYPGEYDDVTKEEYERSVKIAKDCLDWVESKINTKKPTESIPRQEISAMSTQKKVRVRFAPSPTGYLHVGGARSALFNFLFARRTGGDFLLRIEDTDRTRFVEDALTEIYDSLKWLGLNWDEGPVIGGGYGPYVQSERLDIYGRMAEQLIGSGHAYRCFCTPERLAEVRAAQEKSGGATGYDKRCRDLSAEEIDKNLKAGIPHVVRLKIPDGRTVAFDDLIRGRIEYRSEALDDLVLIKADKFPTYHLANVVDDHEMAITHVLRGDEWIASTPRHVLLYEAFGWEPPAFAHLPVILSPDGGKLSKRKGAASVMDYKRGGILPEALFNFLALLGWAPGGDREKMSAEETIAAFSLEHVSPKAAVLDEKKLEWMNGQYLAERPAETLLDEVTAMWRDKGWIQVTSYKLQDNNGVGNGINKEYAMRVIDLLKVRSRRLTELADSASYFFVDPVDYEEKAAKKHFGPGAAERLGLIRDIIEDIDDFTKENIDTAYHSAAETGNIQLSALIHPTRLAISGVSAGPGLFEMMEVIGKEAVLRRIDKAIGWINS